MSKIKGVTKHKIHHSVNVHNLTDLAENKKYIDKMMQQRILNKQKF